MADTSESLSPTAQRARAFFEKANEAAQKNNNDYAIKMYREALKIEPTNLQFRQSLRGVQRRVFQNDPSKVGKLSGARTQPSRMRARSARTKGKFAEALEYCEDAFAHNPWDHHTALIAAEAAEGLEQPVLAKWLLESVGAQGAEDAAFFRQLAHVYELNQDFERAILCWEKVRKLHPGDDEAVRQIKGLSASATISRAGYDSAAHRVVEPGQAGATGEAPQQDSAEAQKRQALSPEDRLHQEIAETPPRVGSFLELADLLRRSDRLDEAEKVLARGLKAIPGEELLIEAYADTQMARLRRAQAAWTRKLREQPDDPAARAKLEQVEAMLADYELKEFRRRAERHPEDANIHFQLGLRLAAAGKHDEAIGEFQKSRSAQNLKLQSLYQAGLCFEAKGLPKLAERNYQEALKLVEPGDTELLNSLHYRLGRAAEAHGDLQTAEEHYNEVAAHDYTYEDVAQRLENLNRRPGS